MLYAKTAVAGGRWACVGSALHYFTEAIPYTVKLCEKAAGIGGQLCHVELRKKK